MRISKKKTLILIIILGLSTLNTTDLTAQSQQTEGISFYEHSDINNNGIVDEGETSKLARLVFEQGENIAIDSKFKSGLGNLYVVSEKGKIMKAVPQEYETGIKSSKLLENLPVGKYTTVFQKEGTNDLAGSYIKVVGKGESLNQEIEKDILQKKKFDFDSGQKYLLICDRWNDFSKDGTPQNWEVSRPQIFKNMTFIEGDNPVILSKALGSYAMVKLKKQKDKSFSDFDFLEKKTRKKPIAVQLPVLTEGDYKINFIPISTKIKVSKE